jgi:hypothetical protein
VMDRSRVESGEGAAMANRVFECGAANAAGGVCTHARFGPLCDFTCSAGSDIAHPSFTQCFVVLCCEAGQQGWTGAAAVAVQRATAFKTANARSMAATAAAFVRL